MPSQSLGGCVVASIIPPRTTASSAVMVVTRSVPVPGNFVMVAAPVPVAAVAVRDVPRWVGLKKTSCSLSNSGCPHHRCARLHVAVGRGEINFRSASNKKRGLQGVGLYGVRAHWTY